MSYAQYYCAIPVLSGTLDCFVFVSTETIHNLKTNMAQYIVALLAVVYFIPCFASPLVLVSTVTVRVMLSGNSFIMFIPSCFYDIKYIYTGVFRGSCLDTRPQAVCLIIFRRSRQKLMQ